MFQLAVHAGRALLGKKKKKKTTACQNPTAVFVARGDTAYYQEPIDSDNMTEVVPVPQNQRYGAMVPAAPPGQIVRMASFSSTTVAGRPPYPGYPGYPGFGHPHMPGYNPYGYPGHMNNDMIEPPVPKQKKPKKRRGWEECKTVFAIICFCASIIVKGVAYSNSHWANSDRLNVNRNLEKFPIMSQFLDRSSGSFKSDCEDQKCRLFFEQYNSERTRATYREDPPPKLYGTYSRGANSRCETVRMGDIEGDVDTFRRGTAGISKYEKCVIDKEREINDFKTVRVLLIVSMVTDGAAILSWIVTFVKDVSELPGRAALAVAALFGFISTLLGGLSVGLFAQAVDIFTDTSLTMGWPYYIVVSAVVLTLVTTGIAAWNLYEGKRRERREAEAKLERMYNAQYGPRSLEQGPQSAHEPRQANPNQRRQEGEPGPSNRQIARSRDPSVDRAEEVVDDEEPPLKGGDKRGRRPHYNSRDNLDDRGNRSRDHSPNESGGYATTSTFGQRGYASPRSGRQGPFQDI